MVEGILLFCPASYCLSLPVCPAASSPKETWMLVGWREIFLCVLSRLFLLYSRLKCCLSDRCLFLKPTYKTRYIWSKKKKLWGREETAHQLWVCPLLPWHKHRSILLFSGNRLTSVSLRSTGREVWMRSVMSVIAAKWTCSSIVAVSP